MIFTDRSRSELERIQRVWDMEECKKLAAKQMFYYANDDRKGMIEELWVREPENAKTASFGRNWGFYLGIDEIERYFVECDQTGETGFMANHPMSSCALTGNGCARFLAASLTMPRNMPGRARGCRSAPPMMPPRAL